MCLQYLIRRQLYLDRFSRNFGAIRLCLTAPIFTLERMCHEALARAGSRTGLLRHKTPHDDLAGSLGAERRRLNRKFLTSLEDTGIRGSS
jgi:hypothetical protein